MGLIKEFREFALKGSVIDLAVGVIIGAAFGGLVKSLVDDVLMPPIGRLIGGLDFRNLYVSLSDKVDAANTEVARRVASTMPSGTESIMPTALDPSMRLPLDRARELGPVIAYGNFITLCINFAIVAFCIFLLIKAINTAKKKFEKQQAAAPETAPADVQLLGEIRDILKAQSK
jgi:large conductance mechanosensitive channel